MLAAPSYRIAAVESLLTKVGFRFTCVPLFHIIYSPPHTTRNNILPTRLSNSAVRPRRYNSVYFLLLPRALFTGYLAAFNSILAFAAAMRSMPSLSLMRIR